MESVDERGPRRPARVAAAIGLLVAAAAAALALAPAPAAAFDPALEAQNFAKIQERNVYEVLTPAFQARMQQQNAQDAVDLPLLLAGDPERNPLGNICAQRKNECAGDVRFIDWADEGYGIRTPILFTGRSGAVISGNVWRTREGPAVKPGIVITTGSVQAPETLYWGIAAALAKRGYVVLTYDVQGQGRSDTFGENPDRQEGFPSQGGQPFYDGTEDALNFMLSNPTTTYSEVMTPSCGNANGGTATSHVAKQVRREGEEDVISGLPHATEFNPFWEYVDPDRIGIAGHSLGAGAVSYIGQRDPRVKAIAAWDNLSTPSGGSSCPARPDTRTQVPITKPAIGFSNDYGLTQNPYTTDPNPQAKTGAFQAYKAAGVDSMQVNTRGGTHYEYSFIPGNTANQPLGNATFRGMHMAIWYTAAWMDKYVKCPGATDPVACEQLADEHLLTDRWRDDAAGEAVDVAGDPNMYSFYLRSRFDFTTQDGSEAICDDMRTGCASMAPDGDPAYPGDYSYIDEANSPDAAVPAAPAFTDTDPDSPSADNAPFVKGTAPAGSTVAIYDNAACTGTPAAEGSAADFASAGLQVSVADNSTTTFHGTATDDVSMLESACSTSSITYVHQTAPPAEPDTQITSGPTGPTADNDPEFAFSSPGTPSATFECRLDSSVEADFAACTSPRAYTDLADGEHTFEVRAVDGGVEDPSPAAATFTVDTTAPAAPVLTATEPEGPANDNEPEVIGTAEANSLVELYASADCTGPSSSVTAAQLADPGVTQAVGDDSTTDFSAVAADGLANTSGCSESIAYVEDSTAPDTVIDSGPGAGTDPGDASFAFSSPDEDADAYECRLDGSGAGGWSTCTSPKAYGGLAEGNHHFEVRASDAAGNTDATPARNEFTVEEGEIPEPPKPCSRTIRGTDQADELLGSPRSDRILGFNGRDRIRSRGGDDCVNGGNGGDRISGGGDNDELRGRNGADRINGGGGRDRLGGGRGNDVIRAADGVRDVISCGPGKDRVFADAKDKIARGCDRVRIK